MNVFVHDINGTQVAEMQSEGIVIRSARDAAEIAKELLSRGINKLILHGRNLSPEFWQISNDLERVVLQEFTSKAIAVAFVGKGGLGMQAHFFETVESAKVQLSTT